MSKPIIRHGGTPPTPVLLHCMSKRCVHTRPPPQPLTQQHVQHQNQLCVWPGCGAVQQSHILSRRWLLGAAATAGLTLPLPQVGAAAAAAAAPPAPPSSTAGENVGFFSNAEVDAKRSKCVASWPSYIYTVVNDCLICMCMPHARWIPGSIRHLWQQQQHHHNTVYPAPNDVHACYAPGTGRG